MEKNLFRKQLYFFRFRETENWVFAQPYSFAGFASHGSHGVWERGLRVCVWPFYPPHLSASGLKAVKQRPSSITAFRQSGLALISNHRTYTHTDTHKVPWDGVIKRGGGDIWVSTTDVYYVLSFSRVFRFTDSAFKRLHNLSKQSVGECFFVFV